MSGTRPHRSLGQSARNGFGSSASRKSTIGYVAGTLDHIHSIRFGFCQFRLRLDAKLCLPLGRAQMPLIGWPLELADGWQGLQLQVQFEFQFQSPSTLI